MGFSFDDVGDTHRKPVGGHPLGPLLVVGSAANFFGHRVVALWRTVAWSHHGGSTWEKDGPPYNVRVLCGSRAASFEGHKLCDTLVSEFEIGRQTATVIV